MKPFPTTTASYLVVKQAVSQEWCELLSAYACFQANLKPRSRRNDPIAGTHRVYGDPLMEVLLERLTPTVEAATGLALWPTLSFYYTYLRGGQLSPHRDRSSCQIVAGLCIGVDDAYQQTHGTWPLILEGQPIAVERGDLLIFRGSETTHWRDVFEGQWFVSAIFAYVEQEGPFAFLKYDQRKQLGKPHIGMFRWAWGLIWHRYLRPVFATTPPQ